MIIVRILAYLLGTVGLIGTLLPFLPYDDFWIRGFDYPRQQLIFILGLATVLWLISNRNWDSYDYLIGIVLFVGMSYQVYRMLPYSSLWSIQSQSARQDVTDDTSLSLLICNVLQDNSAYDKVIDTAMRQSPDILVTLESNKDWGEALHEGLDDSYPFHVSVPLENMYGMHVFSKIKLLNPKVKYRIKNDIPSVDVTVRLGNGEEIDLYFLHPMPPSPSEAYASTGRDAELALVGLEVEKKKRNAIVAGDMNDVAWSHSSRLFQRISGLLDPRRGRGFFATFHADYWFIRWPLDHIFHSKDLAVVELKKLGYVGSDHFPVYAKFNFERNVSSGEAMKSTGEDDQEAEEVIEDGQTNQKDILIPEGK